MVEMIDHNTIIPKGFRLHSTKARLGDEYKDFTHKQTLYTFVGTQA